MVRRKLLKKFRMSLLVIVALPAVLVSRKSRRKLLVKLALPAALPGGVEPVDPAYAAAFVDFCHTLLNSNEFLYVN